MPVSQTAACDWETYDIAYRNPCNEPNQRYLPLSQDRNGNYNYYILYDLLWFLQN